MYNIATWDNLYVTRFLCSLFDTAGTGKISKVSAYKTALPHGKHSCCCGISYKLAWSSFIYANNNIMLFIAVDRARYGVSLCACVRV